MKRRVLSGFLGAGLVLDAAPVRAATSLAEVTPTNVESGTFRLTSRAARDHTVEFVIRRDIRNVSMPERAGYVSHPAVDGNTLGKRLKPELHGKTQTYRFSVPEERVAGTFFTLWGYGVAAGEPGVTYRSHLDQFWKRGKQ